MEILHSIQDILFPIDHTKSERTLIRLIKEDRFDPDCRCFDGYIRREDVPADLPTSTGAKDATIYMLL